MMMEWLVELVVDLDSLLVGYGGCRRRMESY